MAFHVPDEYRVLTGPFGSDPSYGNNGAFLIPGPRGKTLYTLVSDQMGWDHVSVSVRKLKRCPWWEEMTFIKNLFWDAEDTVMQLHPPESDYVNCHPTTLHLWRPHGADIPRPPSIMVGPK